MNIYLFIYETSSCGGHCIAIFNGDQGVKAFDYMANHKEAKFLHMLEGQWDMFGEIPPAKNLKLIKDGKELIKK